MHTAPHINGKLRWNYDEKEPFNSNFPATYTLVYNAYSDTTVERTLKSHLGLEMQPRILDPITVLDATNLLLVTPS